MTFYERITIKDAAGNPVIEWEISSNPYGDGVMSQFGSDRFGDYTASWGEFEPDWLTDPAST
ncbi:hypothetical protein [Mycobacterium sp. E1747]|uniref:hypothetical protein n=1 Tax=Mycobacterium sp. E1747 TaxID=1834128 RepID=UPI0018D34BAE|nr:hypothetical protein [Mycobacterium sp. E1747]